MGYKDKTRFEYQRRYKKLNRDKINEKQRQYRYDNGSQSMSENKLCSDYLGCHVAERLLLSIFKDVKRSPYCTKGYDFKCANDYLIDIKSSCVLLRSNGIKYWFYTIKHNTIADYFLCIAFDNRNDLNPLYLWLIPNNILSHLISTTISENTLNKWSQYEKPIDKVILCCNQMKNND